MIKKILTAFGILLMVLFFSANYSFADDSTSTDATSTDTGGLGYTCSYHYLTNGTYDPSYQNGCFTSYTTGQITAPDFIVPNYETDVTAQTPVVYPWDQSVGDEVAIPATETDNTDEVHLLEQEESLLQALISKYTNL